MTWNGNRIVHLISTVSVFAVLGLTAGIAAAQDAPTFEVAEVAQFSEFYPTDLNNRGEVVGRQFAWVEGRGVCGRPVRWFEGGMEFLDIGPENCGAAVANNDQGQILGFVDQAGQPYRMFLYSSPDDMVWPYLDELFEGDAVPLDLNDAGQVILRHTPSGGPGFESFFFDGSAPHELMPVPEHGRAVDVRALNNLGISVGNYEVPYGDSWYFNLYGFVWSGGSFSPVGDEGETVSLADINDEGQVVGSARLFNDNRRHAVLYEGSELHSLGTLGGASSSALGINNRGWIVGESALAPPGSGTHAFLVLGAVMHDLNSLVPEDLPWVLTNAVNVNDRGQVLVWAYPKDWNTHRPWVLLLTPAAIDTVEELIELLEGYELPKGVENGFRVKLEHALEAIEDGDLDRACNLLGAFVNHVNAQEGKKLTEDQAAELFEGAANVQEAIGCSG